MFCFCSPSHRHGMVEKPIKALKFQLKLGPESILSVHLSCRRPRNPFEDRGGSNHVLHHSDLKTPCIKCLCNPMKPSLQPLQPATLEALNPEAFRGAMASCKGVFEIFTGLHLPPERLHTSHVPENGWVPGLLQSLYGFSQGLVMKPKMV